MVGGPNSAQGTAEHPVQSSPHQEVTWGRMCSAASPPAQKSSAELSFGACRRSPRPCIPVPASPSSMTLLASEFFNLREKRVTKEAELSVLKESASFLPLGFPQPYKPSTKPERAGTLPDTEISQSHGASLSSLHQCHSSQLVFAGSWFFFLIITFLFSQEPWPPSSPSPPCQ